VRLRKRLPCLHSAEILRSASRTLASAVTAGFLGHAVYQWVHVHHAGHRYGDALLGIGVYGLVLLLVARLLKSEELMAVKFSRRRS